jgi:peptidyl-tRNA hydrolase, PTH2 family
MEYKQVILVRSDLKLSKGKVAAQVAHASTEATLRSDDQKVKAWRAKGMKKVILKVDGEKDLLEFNQFAKDAKITSALITDAGRTEIAPGTITCLAIGPEKEDIIDKITSNLKLM